MAVALCPWLDRWLLLQLRLASGTGSSAVGELDVRHHLLAGGAAGRMDGIGRDLAPGRWLHAQNGSDAPAGRWPTLLLATPWHPPVAAITQPAPFIPRTEPLSMLHSSDYWLIRVR